MNNYLFDVKSIVLMEDIPQEMILNWDQVGMKIVLRQHGQWRSLELSGLKLQQLMTRGKLQQFLLVH